LSISGVTVRALRESELKELVRIWRMSGLQYRAKGRDSLANLRMQRRSDPELFVGAFDKGKLVGAVIASDDGRRAWINRLAVIPETRGRGIATLLIRHCEKALRRRGRRLFCVHIEHDNPESMKLFAKEGYRREDMIFYYAKRDSEDY